jgi:hypothetical protein
VIEFYPEIHAVHVGAVLVSGALFLLRGFGVLLGARWPQAAQAAPVRWLSIARTHQSLGWLALASTQGAPVITEAKPARAMRSEMRSMPAD